MLIPKSKNLKVDSSNAEKLGVEPSRLQKMKNALSKRNLKQQTLNTKLLLGTIALITAFIVFLYVRNQVMKSYLKNSVINNDKKK